MISPFLALQIRRPLVDFRRYAADPSDVLQLIVRFFILDVHDQSARRVLEGGLDAVPFAELLPQGAPAQMNALVDQAGADQVNRVIRVDREADRCGNTVIFEVIQGP